MTLSEDELYASIAMAFFYTHNLAEGAGASTLMAAAELRDQLRGKRVVLQMSGCNASPEEIALAVERPEFTTGLAQFRGSASNKRIQLTVIR